MTRKMLVGVVPVNARRQNTTYEARRPVSASADWVLSPLGFSVGILFVSLYLQRFAIPFGSALKVSVATPLGFLLVLWAFSSGTLALDRRRVAIMLGLCGIALIAYAIQVNLPLAMAPRSSLVSGIYWLAVTSFAVLRFAEPLDETKFFRVVNMVLVSIGIAGLIQFAAQFAGLRIFAFSPLLPGQFLIEEQFHLVAPLTAGVIRSNGFFLVEASTFSQFMAAGLIIEILYFKRAAVLCLLMLGLLVSASGTGWLVLGIFVLGTALTHGKSGIMLAFLTLLLIGIAFGALVVLFPDLANVLVGRSHEFTMPGTSGYERFATPFMLLRDVLDRSARAAITGIGPGASEAVDVPYKYGVNTPVKVMLEYGIFGLLFYLGLILTAIRTSRQSALVLPMMFLLLFSGGNQLFSPILFPILLLITISDLAPSTVATPLSARAGAKPPRRTPLLPSAN